MEWLKKLFARSTPAAPGELPAWRRGTYGRGMQPYLAYNGGGTWCKTCGDWITDDAYTWGHWPGHRPREGSWNHAHPEQLRREPDDIQPSHEEWLEEMREFAREREGQLFSCTGPGIDPTRTCSFHSAEEARGTLEPYGLEMTWNPNTGFLIDGKCTGGWWIHPIPPPQIEY